jgi:chemotaxis protein methyltransferase CheR
MEHNVSQREFHYTREDFELLRKLVNEHTGISLSDHKQEMLYSRLSRRLRVLKLDSFASYYRLLQGDCGDELMQFINAMTTNLTAFFREPHHFEFLKNELLPRLKIQHAISRKIRIWSAGCASGEEPYSIAMVVREAIPADWDVKILATDLDSAVLEKAKLGIYPEEKIANVPKIYLTPSFKRGTGAQKGKVHVEPELQKMVTFKPLNLIHTWPMRGHFDIIFCRNVIIYFDKETQTTLFERFANILVPNGHLFVGHSENLFKLTTRFRLLKQTVYMKSE